VKKSRSSLESTRLASTASSYSNPKYFTVLSRLRFLDSTVMDKSLVLKSREHQYARNEMYRSYYMLSL